ncbi:MAG: hypothetical protein M0037_04415, partial [Betaproteobacteria bacterium]|nr:hypothetical protein [Betaproteobacteria bacterium]
MTRLFRNTLVVGVLCANAIGLAHAGLFTDDVAEARITALQQEVHALKDRVGKLENAQQNQAMNLLTQVEAAKDSVATLQGEVEVLSHNIDMIQQGQKSLYAD